MRRLAPLVGAILLLSACAHHRVATEDGLSYTERQARLAAIDAWDLRGQLVVDTGERRDGLNVSWEQHGAELRLTIRSRIPGAGGFRIEGDASRLTIEGRGETSVLTDPERELSERMGWWLPVTSLEHWLLGRPDPDFRSRVDRAPSGALANLSQRDWRIDYEQYQLIDNLLFPRVIRMTHDTLELRLTVRDFDAIAD
jgi:outer membrane lipoprotein LolB